MITGVERSWRMDSARTSSSAADGVSANGAAAVDAVVRRSTRVWRTLRNTAVAIGVAVAVYALLGFLVLPALLKPKLEATLSEHSARQATLGRLEFNPFTFRARLRDFALSDRDPQRPFLRFETLDLDISLASIGYRAPVFDAVRLVRPQVEVTRNADGTSSVDDIVQWPAATARAPTPLFSLNNIEIDDGTVTLDDRPHQRRIVASNIGIGVPFLSSLAHDATIRVTPHVDGTVDGTRFQLGASATSPFLEKRDGTIDLDFDALPLARYAEYLPLPGAVRLRDGALTTRLRLAFVADKGVARTIVLSGTARLDKPALARADGSPLMAARAIDVSLGKLDWLAHSAAIDRVLIDAPDAQLRREADGAFEFARVITTPAKAAQTPVKPWSVNVADVRVDAGRLHVADRSVKPAFEATLSNLRFGGKRLATSGAPGNVELVFDADDGAHAMMQGDIDVAGAALRGRFAVTGLDVPRMAPYYAAALDADIRRGKLDVAGDFEASTKGEALAFTVSGGSASLAGMDAALRGERDPFLRIAQMRVDGVAFDAARHSVTIDDAQWHEGSIRVLRQHDGTLAVARVARGAGTGRATAQPAAAADAPWSITLRKVAVDGVAADIEDRGTGPLVKLRVPDVRLTAENVTNADTGKAVLDVAMRIGARGRARLHGTLANAPLVADLRVDANGIDLVPLRPYFESRTSVVVTGGSVVAKGRLVYAAGRAGAPRVSFKGDAAIADFASLDRPMSEELMRWKRLRMTAIDATSEPFAVAIGAVALDGFYARLILSAEGRLNLTELLAPASPGDDAAPVRSAAGVTSKELPPRASGALPVSIGRIDVSSGELQYSDFFVRPNYSAHLSEVAGSVTALSASQAGQVDIAGRVEGTAPVNIRGSVNPFAEELQLDVTGKATDVDLPPLTPYSIKYAGYGIEKGKLSLEVHYKIDNRRLAATNRLKLDQLTFGGHVDSPTATKLPVLLAVSLLKDRNGVIDLDLPIQGTLDDPQFSVWRVVVQIFVNLVTKAVTAPFALLGSIGGGGGEQLAYVEFAPGSADLSEASRRNLSTLAKALADRPGLRLDAAGRAIPDVDREGLKRAMLDRAVRARKTKAMAADGESAPPPGSLTIDAAEYPKLLSVVYRETDLPDKPRNVLGIAKTIPAAEMESRLLASYRIDDAALTTLANQRAETVRQWFTHEGGIAAERIFVVAPKLGADGIKDSGLPTRVDFAIR